MSFFDRLFRSKEEPIETYADFWNWFTKHQLDFHKAVRTRDSSIVEREVFGLLGSALNQLRDGYFFLAGMLDDSTAELVFTADGNPKNVVFVEELVDAAPDIPGWQFTSLKQPVEGFDIRINGIVFGTDSLSFFQNENIDQPDLIDITIVHEAFDESDAQSARNGAYIFLDNYLGELTFLEDIDELSFAGPASVNKDLIPIDALPNYLETRRALFVEKYDGVRIFTENDEHASYQAEHEDGSPLIAVMNTDLLKWDAKASHPWMLVITIGYDGTVNNGLPDQDTYEKLDAIEESLVSNLKDSEGYLYIGRQSARGKRTVFIACVDFRRPSKVAYEAKQRFSGSGELAVDYEIFKDKYWQSVSYFAG
ncbi:MAG: DUF695 domain-containing protein [Pyrinomonadaceae bacterium]